MFLCSLFIFVGRLPSDRRNHVADDIDCKLYQLPPPPPPEPPPEKPPPPPENPPLDEVCGTDVIASEQFLTVLFIK